MTAPKHLELFMRSDGVFVAQCRTETAGRLDDPVPLAVAGDIWTKFKDDWSAAQLAQIADLTAANAALTQELAGRTAERDALQATAETIPDLQSQLADLVAERDAFEAEVTRLTALVPPPANDYEVTRSEFLSRMQSVDASIILDIWKAQSPEAIMAAVALFTHDGLVDLRPNSRTHQMLQSLIPLGIITEEQVQSLLVEG